LKCPEKTLCVAEFLALFGGRRVALIWKAMVIVYAYYFSVDTGFFYNIAQK
jgi:hypothetical protein